ncbi:MAG TPA: glycosyltransferase [Solirubrobacteraceae bacterium]|jgi:tetratricopeptide (TPR) repeat protein|nr:glycosyltransferase [Solirubrobacteraceae bacterium]
MAARSPAPIPPCDDAAKAADQALWPVARCSDGSAALAIELSARAQRLLAAGKLDDYRRLFGELGSIADQHRRYQAGVSLIELGLAASGDAPRARVGGLFLAIAAGAVELLEQQPSEPKLLNYAGVALYELWSLDAARALFKAAKGLDPRSEQVDDNLAALARRRRQLRGAGRTVPQDPALLDLASQALAIAGRARPAAGMRLSLCMIVRDEQEMLPRCLASVAGAVDEIVIVDTGSTDATVEIARSFGARVLSHEWTGSFAQARNVSFDAAEGDWLLCLDADEVLVEEDVPLLRALTGRTWREAFYLSETNYTGDLEDGTAVTHNALRIFRNRPEYRFEGRLHEQIAHCLPGYLPERVEASGVRIEHYGYLGAVRDSREKSRRNIELLRLQQAESPPTPFLHYNLGSEYAAANEPRAALAEFERSWRLLQSLPDRDSYQFAPALMSRMVKALRACGRPADAIARAEEGLLRFQGFTDLVLEQAIAAIALEQNERAIELLERCIEMGDAPRRYTATQGSGSYLPRLKLAELRQAAGDHEEAARLLEYCLREHTRFIGSVLPYANLLLASGVEPGEVLARVERHMPDPPPAARFMLGTALYESGATTAGEFQFRAVLERQPHSSRARVALGEALLAQRRYNEAAEVACELADDDPLAVIARRTELFARIAGGEGDSAGKTIERARAAGMATYELDLFATWQELARTGVDVAAHPGQSTPPLPGHPASQVSGQGTSAPPERASPLPEQAAEPLSEQPVAPLSELAVAPLEVMLEALLRVHDFKSFEVLLGALESTPLQPRERRELLAHMYLRRGFPASAAGEWMAVCEQEPDVQALVGLARVAAVRGMAHEMSDFAAAALARDPDNEDAASLLSQAHAATA